MAVARQQVYYDRFKKLQTQPGFQHLRTYKLLPGEVVKFEFELLAKQTDQNHRASFTRIATFYRKGEDHVKLQGNLWHTLETTKSSVIMDIEYTVGLDSVSIRSKNAGNTSTTWIIRTRKLSLQ